MAVGGILAAIIVLFSRIIDVPILGLGAWAVYFAMFGSRRLYQYMKTKEEARLAQAVIEFNPTAKLALILCIALEAKFEDLFYFD